MPPVDPQSQIRQELEASAELKRRVARDCTASIAQAAQLLIETFQHHGRLLLCGNGGSAADCQHIAAEFVSALNHDSPRPALDALALTTDTSFLTANANDFGFDQVFVRQVEAHGRAGDTLLAISTSGASKNVLRALERARTQGLKSIALTGGRGGEAVRLADVAIEVPSTDTQRIQESHITIGHILCGLVEQAFFSR